MFSPGGNVIYVSGVLYNGIITRWGCRPVGCLGGVITAIGILLSAFAPTFYFLYLSLGLLCGMLPFAKTTGIQQLNTSES